MKKNLTIIAFFLLLTFFMTFPLAIKAGSSIYGYYDSLFNTWVLSWDIHKFETGLSNFFDANIYYPHERVLTYSDHLIAVAILALPVTLISKNPVLTYNIMLFSSFVLSGFFMYLLAYYLTGNRFASFLAGVIFAFTPYRLLHIYHLQLEITQWIPLVFLFLHKFMERLDYKNLLLFTLFFLLNFLSSGYYALFLSFFVGLFIILFLFHRGLFLKRDVWFKLGLFTIISAAVILPIFYPYIVTKRVMGFTRDYGEILNYPYSADVLSYLSEPFSLRPWSAVTQGEKNLFLGIIPLFLGALGFYSAIKKRDILIDSKRQFGVHLFYMGMLILAFILSLGPIIKFNGKEIVTGPYILLFKYVPGFDGLRVPARLAIFVVLSLSLFAAFGVKFLMERLKGNYGRIGLVSVLTAIILIEYNAFSAAKPPLDPIETGNKIPAVYKWLAKQKGDFGIIELPTGESVLPGDLIYIYFSIYHWKGLFNGYSGYFPPAYNLIKEAVKGFPDALSKGLLKDIGVRYVILHGKRYDAEILKGMKAAFFKDKDLKLVSQFDDDYVYELKGKREYNNEGLIAISRSGWSAKASISEEIADKAFDNTGDISSRWTTGRPQRPGDYFELNLGDIYKIAKISMKLGNINDYPRGYKVEASLDGAEWNLIAKEDSARFPIVSLVKEPLKPKFDILFYPANARYIRITQTGSHKEYGWSIAEIHVFKKVE
ncbi:MAG: discoidin domain-containing protein [Nitrospirae bacterium]|nr:discoidin domain-containing protein [Nitrospirota bacterium]